MLTAVGPGAPLKCPASGVELNASFFGDCAMVEE